MAKSIKSITRYVGKEKHNDLSFWSIEPYFKSSQKRFADKKGEVGGEGFLDIVLNGRCTLKVENILTEDLLPKKVGKKVKLKITKVK